MKRYSAETRTTSPSTGCLGLLFRQRISSSKLKSALNAQFRVHLDQAMKDDVFVISKPKMKVTNPKDVEEEEQDFDDEEEDD